MGEVATMGWNHFCESTILQDILKLQFYSDIVKIEDISAFKHRNAAFEMISTYGEQVRKRKINENEMKAPLPKSYPQIIIMQAQWTMGSKSFWSCMCNLSQNMFFAFILIETEMLMKNVFMKILMWHQKYFVRIWS